MRIPSGCAVSAIFSKSGERRSGEDIIKSIALMHDRSNGLGGGFAAYGIYPEYKNLYALHVFYEGKGPKDVCEAFINEHFDVVNLSKIPTRKTPAIKDEPLIWRYFVEPLHTKLAESQLDEDTFVSRCVIRVNSQIEGAYIFSSGKDMGVFKAVGYPEDVGEFYRFAQSAGVDMETLQQVVAVSAGGSTQFERNFNKMVADDYRPTFALALLRKDMSIALASAQSQGLSLPLSEEAFRLFKLAAAFDKEDCSAIAKVPAGA